MKGRRNIIIAVSAIVVFAAIVGFFITLDVSPQIAYARLFIDAGLVIGLVAVIMAFYKEREFSTDSVVQTIRSLKNGQYKTRLAAGELGPLADIATSINELACALEDQHKRQEEIKRNLREELLPSLKAKEMMPLPEHSFHPELGPVLNLPEVRNEMPQSFRDVMPVPIPSKSVSLDNKLNNTLIDSKPPKFDTDDKDQLPSPLHEEQNMSELYERFVAAQRAFNIDQIEFALFLKTIEKTKEELKSSYKCDGILFDIVKESNQVALQPKIIRSSPL